MRRQANGKVRRSEKEWRTILARYRKSGLSVAAFCQREKISKNTLSKWKVRLRGAKPKQARFVELGPVASATSSRGVSGELEIELPGGILLRWRA